MSFDNEVMVFQFIQFDMCGDPFSQIWPHVLLLLWGKGKKVEPDLQVIYTYSYYTNIIIQYHITATKLIHSHFISTNIASFSMQNSLIYIINESYYI